LPSARHHNLGSWRFIGLSKYFYQVHVQSFQQLYNYLNGKPTKKMSLKTMKTAISISVWQCYFCLTQAESGKSTMQQTAGTTCDACRPIFEVPPTIGTAAINRKPSSAAKRDGNHKKYGKDTNYNKSLEVGFVR